MTSGFLQTSRSGSHQKYTMNAPIMNCGTIIAIT